MTRAHHAVARPLNVSTFLLVLLFFIDMPIETPFTDPINSGASSWDVSPAALLCNSLHGASRPRQ